MEIHHGWMSPPSGRGTSDIIYNCLFTIVICCWSALHMNVPARNDSKVTILLRKIRWMLITLLAPEFTCFLAFKERAAAHTLRSKIRKLSNIPPNLSNWNITHYFLVTMGGVSIRTTHNEYFRLRVEQFYNLLGKNVLEIPELSEDEINDKSKADWFIKFIAVVQILWFVAEIIGRAVQHLSITTIELFTLATVSTTIFTYALWWQKPQDVKIPFVFQTQASIEDLNNSAPKWMREGSEAFGQRMSIVDDYSIDFLRESLMYAFMALVATVFGACHIIGWDFFFRTSVERLLWRISGLACIAGPCCIILSRMVENGGDLSGVSITLGVLVYTVVRLYLLGEAIAGLRALPVTAYQTVDWTRFLPHV